MEKEIKGIFELDNESKDFEKKVSDASQEGSKGKSLGIKMSAEWEADRVTCFLEDKEGLHIGDLVFDCNDIVEIFKDIVNPKHIPDKELENMSEEEKKQLNADAKESDKEMQKNLVNEEIDKYHKKD